ncbi:MAG: ABC transporter ATP-binding protein [Actinobacteria bacterium]|nr:ABC transporter ATP-binding protein [Actinomycetota bacterium]
MSAFLEVKDLHVSFPTGDGVVRAVDGLSFRVDKGRTLAIVGESGSGKSVTAQAVLGLLNRNFADITGQVWLDGQDLIAMSDDQVRELRGEAMAMIFQDPMSSLHPFYRIGDQLMEAVRTHHKVSKQEARERAIDALKQVGIPAPERRVDDYPHQLSGGMRQRVMIAMALINSPQLLVADEPTTALDVTVQAQITELMLKLQAETGTTLIIITHDLGVVADMADEVTVMYAGRAVEMGSTDDIYYRPEMPYTLGLLASVPRLDSDLNERLDPIPGNPPSLINLPPGCVFNPRCTFKDEVPGNRCTTERPELLASSAGHLVRCHLDAAQRVAAREAST